MLQLSYRGHGRLAVEHVPIPEPAPGHVRVRVHSTGLCTSDVYGYSGLNDRRDAVLAGDEVLVMGHETSGIVDAVGRGVDDIAVGEARRGQPDRRVRHVRALPRRDAEPLRCGARSTAARPPRPADTPRR